MGGGFASLAEGIDEIGDKIFFLGAGFQSLLFVFDDDFVVGDFYDFATGDGKLGVEEALEGRAFNDDLLNEKVVGIDGEIGDGAEFGTFFGFDFKGEEIEIEA